MSDKPSLRKHAGGCHCGAVRYEVLLPERIIVEDCNCSICAKVRNAHVIAPASRFTLIQGEDVLTEYQFGVHVARHLFCKVCGVKSFYIPRSNPDGVAVTYACLDDPNDFDDVEVHAFDGVNWEANAPALASRSKED